MGRGDKKSKKGKIFKGSFGNSRKRTAVKAKSAATKPESATAEAKPKKTAKKKAEA